MLFVCVSWNYKAKSPETHQTETQFTIPKQWHFRTFNVVLLD